jgi:hypothetical protein
LLRARVSLQFDVEAERSCLLLSMSGFYICEKRDPLHGDFLDLVWVAKVLRQYSLSVLIIDEVQAEMGRGVYGGAALVMYFIAIAFPFYSSINAIFSAIGTPTVSFVIPCLAYNWVYRTRAARETAAMSPPRCFPSFTFPLALEAVSYPAPRALPASPRQHHFNPVYICQRYLFFSPVLGLLFSALEEPL